MRGYAYLAAGLGFVLTLFAPRTADAATYRVTITTQPAGASVWVDERDGDAVGQTPYSTRLTPGTHTIFLELEGHEVAVHEITVKKRRRGKQRFRFEMVELSFGSIDVLAKDGDDNADGADVYLDGEKVGTIPDSFESAEGAHQLEVVKEGFKRFESWVEVKKGESIEVEVTLEPVEIHSADVDLGGGERKPADSNAGPIFRIGAGMGAAWRRFAYDNPGSNNLRPYEANGIGLINIDAELYGGGLAPSLANFSLFAAVSLSIPIESEANDGAIAIDTRWLRREVGLRVRLPAGPGTFHIDLAEGGSSFKFQNAGALADEIAEAEYEYARLSIGYGVDAGKLSVGGGGGGVFAFSSKGVSERFDDATIFGPQVYAYLRYLLFAGLQASVAASFTYYDYSLTASPTYIADGGHDLMIDLVGTVGYRY